MTRYKVWQKATKETAPDLIITGAKGDTYEQGFRPDIQFINWMDGTHKNILDFGAGIGRNTFTLGVKYPYVHAFDFPNMIQMLKERSVRCQTKGTYISLFTDWNEVKDYAYSAIFTSLVLQHIHPEDLSAYSNDFMKMTDTLYLITRNYTDFERKSVYEILSTNWKIESIFTEIEPFGSSVLDTEEKIKNATGEQHYACKMKRK